MTAKIERRCFMSRKLLEWGNCENIVALACPGIGRAGECFGSHSLTGEAS